MPMEAITSSLISHRGHNPSHNTMYIRFATKTGVPGSLYGYRGVYEILYQEGLEYVNDKGEVSFGQWFNRKIKPNVSEFPFFQIEKVNNDRSDTSSPTVEKMRAEFDEWNGTGDTKEYSAGLFDAVRGDGTIIEMKKTDFSSGQPIPAEIPETIPEEPEELKKAAEKLAAVSATMPLVLEDVDAYKLAEKTGIAIVRMRNALEDTFRPGIQEAHKKHQAELAILNHYDNPLKRDEDRLRQAMISFNNRAKQKALEEASRLRREEEARAEAEAKRKAEELKLVDALEAESRGEVELAEQIIAAPALPLRSAYIPMPYVAPETPQGGGASHPPKWVVQYVNEKGEPSIDEWGNPLPRMDLIPLEYHLPDKKSLDAIAKRTQNRTNIPGIRVYDAGNVRLSAK